MEHEQTQQTFVRQVAVKVPIDDILKAHFQKGQEWQPTTITLASGMKLGRVNLVGVVVHKEPYSLLIEDSSGSIMIRSFEDQNLLGNVEIGSIVAVTGKPRMYEDQKYVAVETCKAVHNAWLTVRKKEIDFLKKNEPTIKKEHTNLDTRNVSSMSSPEQTNSVNNDAIQEESIVIEQSDQTEKTRPEKDNEEEREQLQQPISQTKKVYDIIKELDTGHGAAYEDVIEKMQSDQTEKIITILLQEGNIFELSPGKLKVLD